MKFRDQTFTALLSCWCKSKAIQNFVRTELYSIYNMSLILLHAGQKKVQGGNYPVFD